MRSREDLREPALGEPWLARAQPRRFSWRRPMEAANEPEVAASSSRALHVRHSRLTMLQQAAPDTVAALDDREKQLVLADARECLTRLQEGQRDRDDEVILSARASEAQVAHIAAALALLCGYYTKRNGTLNPSAAAEAFGHATSRPAQVMDWLAKLERLEAVADRSLHKRHREAFVITSREKEWIAKLEAIVGKDGGAPSLRLLALRALNAQREQPSDAFVAYYHQRFAEISLHVRKVAAREVPIRARQDEKDRHAARARNAMQFYRARCPSHRLMQWFLGMLYRMHTEHASFLGAYGLLADAAREEDNCGACGCTRERLRAIDLQREMDIPYGSTDARRGRVFDSSERAWRDGTAMAERAMRLHSTLVEFRVPQGEGARGSWNPSHWWRNPDTDPAPPFHREPIYDGPHVW